MTLILWSGGFDSTLVLYDECVKAKKEGKGMPRALSINHDQVPAKKQQYRARKAIWKKLKSRGYKFQWSEVSIQTKGMFYPVYGAHLVQPGIWIPQAILYLAQKEDLLTGWTAGGDVFHYMYWIRSSFAYHMDTIGKEGKLISPLEFTPKCEVIQRLKKAKLMSLPWTCEDSKTFVPCQKCKPCLDLKTARYRLKLEKEKGES